MADLSVTRLDPEIPNVPAADFVRMKLASKAPPEAFVMVRAPTTVPVEAFVETVELLMLIMVSPLVKHKGSHI